MKHPYPTNLSTHATNYRPDIDGLRAIAVLLVVGFHAFPNLVTGGFIGVDIFFVISGFLISTIILHGLEYNSFSFFEFYSRRIRRIFPALILILITCYIFGWLILLADEYTQLGKHIAAGSGFISNFILWNESGYFDNGTEQKPLLHLWSLGIEEQFYIIWPLLLWVIWKKQYNLLLITITIIIISFTLNIFNYPNNSIANFYSPQTRFWELLSGSIVSYALSQNNHFLTTAKAKIDTWLHKKNYIYTAKNQKILRDLLSIVGTLLIAISILVITKDKYFPGWWSLLPILGTIAIIYAGENTHLNKIVFSNRILVWFGLISYPLYLWHWPLLTFARISENGEPNQTKRFAILLLSVGLSWLTHTLVERPIRFGTYARTKAASLLALMIIIGCIGYNTYKMDGLPLRFPKIIQDLTTKYYMDPAKWGPCFLTPEQDYNYLNNNCNFKLQSGKENILLWGDSFAAHLFPGYTAMSSKNLNIIEFAASGCPPIIGVNPNSRPFCKKINDTIFHQIETIKPKHIVLAANWISYNEIDPQWLKLQETIIRLKKLKIARIDIIGSPPVWPTGLLKLLFTQFRQFHTVPFRLKSEDITELEAQMRILATGMGINYISLTSILCNNAGCLTRLGDTGETLITWDRGHFTEIAAQYIVAKFPNT